MMKRTTKAKLTSNGDKPKLAPNGHKSKTAKHSPTEPDHLNEERLYNENDTDEKFSQLKKNKFPHLNQTLKTREIIKDKYQKGDL